MHNNTLKYITVLGLIVIWLILIGLWTGTEYNTSEYKKITCSRDTCDIMNVKGYCYAKFTTVPINNICQVKCPGNNRTTALCDLNKQNNCPEIDCKKYKSMGWFFTLISLSILVAGGTLYVIIEFLYKNCGYSYENLELKLEHFVENDAETGTKNNTEQKVETI